VNEALALSTTRLSCRLGRRSVLRDVTLEVRRGEVFGVLGPNGAGKTTLLDVICGLVPPSAGEVSVLGQVRGSRDAGLRARIGVLSQETALYDELDALRNLRLHASLFEVADADARIEELLRLVGLWDRRTDRVGTYSGGMKRRLAIARSLLHDPELLIFDEPTIGVDVEARHAIWQYVRWLRGQGRTLVLTTNYLDEAEALCDRVAILKDGEVVTVDTPRQLIARAGRCIDIDCADDVAGVVRDRLAGAAEIVRVESRPGGLTVFTSDHSGDVERVRELVADHTGDVRIDVRAPALAEVFELLTSVPPR
jgi:ABC-2 type transport system ATP-binding protein